jgi:hypothetical protein
MAESVNNAIMVQSVGDVDVESYTMTRRGIAYDFVVHATNANAGTVTLSIGGSGVSGALNPGSTDDRSVRSANDAAWNTVGKIIDAGDAITFTRSDAGLGYEAYLYIYPIRGFRA